jgi:cell fate (sporulation/competence/biofilm development) regulator YlbF (YheA/YmcA/DUF963 family)
VIDAIIKTDEIINQINKSTIVKRLKELKIIIDNNNEIQILLNDFNDKKKKYESNLITLDALKTSKVNLYNHSVIVEYRKLHSELNLLINKFNKDIIKLLDKKFACGIN